MPTTETAGWTVEAQGASIPRIGLGTWELVGSDAEEAVRDALEIGYRHVDTARAYENEREIGAAIADSEVDREDVFLTTKLAFRQLEPAEVRAQMQGSLRALGTDWVDLLLIHWPNPEIPVAATLEAMAELRDEERVRHIGVSNFPTAELGRALEASPAPLVANQVEFHPYLDQGPLLEMTAERGMALEAYSPLARGDVARDATLAEIGEAHGKSAGQVALRWLIDHPRVAALPRSSSHERRVENIDLFDFELTDAERERIGGLASPDGRRLDPSWAPEWD